MKAMICGLLAATVFTSLISLPASAAGGTATREGRFGRSPSNYVPGYSGYGARNYRNNLIPDDAYAPVAMPLPYPRWEPANSYYTPYYGNRQYDFYDSPLWDLSTYREMNPNTDPIAPSWYSLPMD